ncbi:ectonucleoside triphosphate diphosphohydrolase 5-like [Chironomus tepperi]|uniref:ectonucleoside triphosphate diphosphohydrolase 5-like n=1 Tax=Chironomus tepperi TaxID=113505 RepID=UPI00391F4955
MQKKTIFAVSIFTIAVILVASIAVYCYIIASRTSLLEIEDEKDELKHMYGIVIDAGSTGTRILAFEFERNGTELNLLSEFFKQEKPGLSSLLPQEAKEQIKKLLLDVEEFIPEEFRKSTPLKLKATAGFRLMDPEKSEEILDAVREVFRTSKFMPIKNAVEIIDGNEEGISSWFSINYLRNLLTSDNKVTALDLGGGSTQIAFEIVDDIPENLVEFSHKVQNFDGETELFVKSYLGLGLMALRHAVITENASEDQQNVDSYCINADARPFEWTYQNIVYKITPKFTDNSTFDDCLIAIRKIVSKLLTPKIPSLQGQTINGFSYFYDRSVDAKLIKKNDEGEEIEIEKFRLKALEYCENKPNKDPWMCLDLTFISVLLQDGYGLKDDKKIKLFTKIEGHEASWALGSFLQDYLSQRKRH